MARNKRRTGDTGQAIREAVGGIFSCGVFSPNDFELPAGVGTQLSMTGVTRAYGNAGSFDDAALADVLASYPALRRTGRSCLEKYAARRRFTVLCGNTDRCVAIVGCIRELVNCGITKILITADTNEERDNLYEALSLMRAGLDGVSTTCFGVNDDNTSHRSGSSVRIIGSQVVVDPTRQSLADGLVCNFLTSDTPEVMILAQPSFTRGCNIIRRGGEFSLASYLAKAAPVVLTSSETVDSARSMSVSSSIFDPLAVICFTGEVRTLRDAVIFRPEDASEISARTKPEDDMMQLGF
ncbi:MAG: hypothetical protein J6I42_12380 [Clostridia bacterium]|nr:hypothetical protein [Clostridia bacterium]